VSADLENGFGDDPAACAETIARAADAGPRRRVDRGRDGAHEEPIYPFALAVERVAAAVQAARSLPFPFTLTARAENFITGRPDLADTLRRLEAFAAAGRQRPLCAGTEVACRYRSRRQGGRAQAGQRRDGTLRRGIFARRARRARREAGEPRSSLARAAYGAFVSAAREVRTRGTFTFAGAAIPYAEINGMFK
jgi:2-methylisocitrate lyase-like PEP mutase family enzyme